MAKILSLISDPFMDFRCAFARAFSPFLKNLGFSIFSPLDKAGKDSIPTSNAIVSVFGSNEADLTS